MPHNTKISRTIINIRINLLYKTFLFIAFKIRFDCPSSSFVLCKRSRVRSSASLWLPSSETT